jgi:hypothetical protein
MPGVKPYVSNGSHAQAILGQDKERIHSLTIQPPSDGDRNRSIAIRYGSRANAAIAIDPRLNHGRDGALKSQITWDRSRRRNLLIRAIPLPNGDSPYGATG